MIDHPRNLFGAVALAAVLLAGCGSDSSSNDPPAGTAPPPTAGGGTPPATDNGPPASASANVEGFVAYLQSLLGMTSETAEPVNVSSFNAPTSETTSPAAVQ